MSSITKEELALLSDGRSIEYDRDIIAEFKGSDLVGLSYEPLFDYYANKQDLENRENGWKIYSGDFVTTEEGTGIVHIAPAFGEDDMNLAHEKKLPFVQHVSRSGRFVEFINSLSEEDKIYFVDKDGQGREVKPKRNSRETDEKVVEYLKNKNQLFASENYKHSYPHCWRCDTPLLNYASGSWFVETTKIKDNLIKNNQQVNWVPGFIKDGRFGKWLEDVRDWAVSRSRFWGAPLPIWKCEDCGELEVIGSIDELRDKTDKKITKFIFARHGLSENNVLGIRSDSEDKYPLVEEGKMQAEVLGDKLKDAKIDVIICSPVLRAVETAEIVAKKLNVSVAKEEALRDYDFGSWNGCTTEQLLKDHESYRKYWGLSQEEKYVFHQGESGESRADVEKRVKEFIKEANKKYAGKNILVISHGVVGSMFHRILDEASIQDTMQFEGTVRNAFPSTYYVVEDGKKFDLHKPYIDKIEFKCPKCGKPMKIVGDVFDCWFESGSMPYAQLHYPFENQEKFQKSFPADFIAEGIDQTRGWFYTLTVLSTALFDKPAFKNVIVNGIVLAEDGQKMSKKLKNYPDPSLLLEKYGADSLRYYLLTSPVMKAENLRFSEKGVDEVLKRFILTLWNTYSFFVMNVELNKIEEKDIVSFEKSENLLDKWILSELNLLVSEVNQEMENYDLVKASRPLRDFVDKLSNWYLRRSRKRFASEDMQDKLAAYRTLYYVLVTFTKVMAPFMPFLSDEIFRNLTDKESVHLESFPEVSVESINDELSLRMNLVREVVTLGLAVRAQNRIKVRMPLATLHIKKEGLENLNEELIEILKDELNIKDVKVVDDIEEKSGWGFAEDGGIKVALDLTVSQELESEGLAREIIRQIQSMRKTAGYNRDDSVSVKYEVSENAVKFHGMFEKWSQEIKSECLLSELSPVKEVMKEDFDGIGELAFDNEKVILVIKK
jgi:isoleucyl-tRNA synthetase